MKQPNVLLAAFLLALGAFLAGIAALFAPLVAQSGWWLIAVGVFALPGLALALVALAVFVRAIDSLLQEGRSHRHAVDKADAEAEAAYWIAVARAKELGISVAGYLRHARWTAAEIAELEIRTGRDVDGDGAIGRPAANYPRPILVHDERTGVGDPTLGALEKVLHLAYQVGMSEDKLLPALGYNRELYDYALLSKDSKKAPPGVLVTMGLISGRAKGAEGQLAYVEEEAFRRLRSQWWHATHDNYVPTTVERQGNDLAV